MTPLSLVIIAKNEAHNLPRCLESVPFAAEKLVVENDSSDETVTVAERHGARVVKEKWHGFYAQKKLATELAKNDWILSLDADEALSPELAQEIENILKAGPKASAYALPRKSFHLGRWIKHGGWYPDRQIRLFDRRQANWQGGELHESVRADKVERLKGDLLHWVFKDLSHQVDTNNRYSSLGAEQLRKAGKRFGLFKLLLKPPLKFLETYIWKSGWQDGLPGFVIAVGAAYSMFLKYAKLWEIERFGSNRESNSKDMR